MSGAERRAFQAAMTLKYCLGNARRAEKVFGRGRETIQLGLNEHRTGTICWGGVLLATILSRKNNRFRVPHARSILRFASRSERSYFSLQKIEPLPTKCVNKVHKRTGSTTAIVLKSVQNLPVL